MMNRIVSGIGFYLTLVYKFQPLFSMYEVFLDEYMNVVSVDECRLITIYISMANTMTDYSYIYYSYYCDLFNVTLTLQILTY